MPTPNPATRYSHTGGAAITQLASGITAVSTTFTVKNSAGWPTGSNGPFFVVLSEGLSNMEKVRCSSRTGDVVTVDGGAAGRGQDGTTAADHAADAGNVYPCWTSLEADLLNEHAASISGVHGATGNVVGHSDAQTISNKTFNSTNAYAGGALSGTFTGSPTLSGNPTFSGVPVFSGNPNFTGAPTLANYTNAQHDHGDADDGGGLANPTIAGAALSGTITGSPAFSGAPTFSGAALFSGKPIFAAAAAATEVLGALITGDADDRLAVRADGRLVWGDGTASDTNLFRDSANVLRTNDSLVVDTNLTVGGDLAVSGIGREEYHRVTSNVNFPNTTLADVGALSFTTVPNAEYEVEFVLNTDGDSAADIKLGVVVPSGATQLGIAHGLAQSGSLGTDDQTTLFDESTQPVFGLTGVGSKRPIHIKANVVTGGSGGTYKIRAAQDNSSGTNTRVLAGSWGKVKRVA